MTHNNILNSKFNSNDFNYNSLPSTNINGNLTVNGTETVLGTITAPNFTGQALNSTNINLTDEGLQNSGCLIPFSLSTNGNQRLKTNSSLNFNPNTGILSSAFISTTVSITSNSSVTSGGLITANGGVTSNLIGIGKATNASYPLDMLGDFRIAKTASSKLGTL